MHRETLDNWVPANPNTETGNRRRAGIEFELAGPGLSDMSLWVQQIFGGEIVVKTRFEYEVRNTEFGDFTLELDSAYLKNLAEEQAQSDSSSSQLETIYAELLGKTSELLVPWEIVTPPIDFADLVKLRELVDTLRNHGALGTRHALHYAFGVHLNPELPSLETSVIVDYLRAYFCLYDWIKDKENIDLARKLTPYINHFKKSYIEKVIDPDYQPTEQQMIDDYLTHNPTRNRSLDLLPLFAYLDKERVFKQIDDPRIKARPTLHYRLPNCDIDNPNWNLDQPWGLWLEVEALANDRKRLHNLCREYQVALNRLTHPIDKRWVKRIDTLLG